MKTLHLFFFILRPRTPDDLQSKKKNACSNQDRVNLTFSLSLFFLPVFSKSSGEWNLLPPDSGQELAERTHIKVGLEKKENLLLKERKKEKSTKKRKSKSRSPSRSKSSSKKSAKYNR